MGSMWKPPWATEPISKAMHKTLAWGGGPMDELHEYVNS